MNMNSTSPGPPMWSIESPVVFVCLPSGNWVRADAVVAVFADVAQPGHVGVVVQGGAVIDGGEGDEREIVELLVIRPKLGGDAA